MNIYDLPIPNFGELSDEAALELILAVRSRRRRVSERSPKTVSSPNRREKKFTTPFGKFTKEEIRALLENLK